MPWTVTFFRIFFWSGVTAIHIFFIPPTASGVPFHGAWMDAMASKAAIRSSCKRSSWLPNFTDWSLNSTSASHISSQAEEQTKQTWNIARGGKSLAKAPKSQQQLLNLSKFCHCFVCLATQVEDGTVDPQNELPNDFTAKGLNVPWVVHDWLW